MSVRLIAGRAGSGKTHGCLAAIREELARSLMDGPRLVFLVPEQAAMQMERGLLAGTGRRILGRCEVISFRRLAHRVLADAEEPVSVPLTPLGREMALRHLIGKHRRALREFSQVCDRGRFLAAICRGIAELLQESVTLDQLAESAARAEKESHPSAARLHDLALLYRAYLEYLGEGRVDPESVLDLARDRLAGTEWLCGARIWIDGFAGFTQQQMRMIVALAERAADIDLTLLMEPRVDKEPDPLGLFARTEETWNRIAGALREAGVAIERPVLLRPQASPRFGQSPALAQLERSLFANPPAGTGTADGIRLVAARDHRAEAAACIRGLIDLVQAPEKPLRYRDIAIVVRDLEPYHDLLSAELRQHRIPFFIDRRRPTFHHPLIQLIRAALSMQGEAPFDQAVSALFKTGLSGLSDAQADGLENYALAHGLKTPERWRQTWTLPPPAYAEQRKSSAAAERELTWLNEARAALQTGLGEWVPHSKASRPACRVWIARLHGLLTRLELPGRLEVWSRQAAERGEFDEAAEHEQVWTDVVHLFEDMENALGDEAMTIRQFRDCLESALGELTLGLVPATLDQVLVSSIERSRHPPVKAVFVLGFGDGQFPARIAEDTILGDEERQRLEAGGVRLSRSRRARLLDERMLAYIAFTRATEFLWVSYPQADERGRAMQPSAFWPALEAALPGVKVEGAEDGGPGDVTSPSGLAAALAGWARLRVRPPISAEAGDDSDWHRLYEWARGQPVLQPGIRAALSSLEKPGKATLSPGIAAELWDPPYRTSVTALEKFAWCPFQHFAEKGLGLKERSRAGLSPLDMGRLYHTVLQQFVNEMIESGEGLREMSPEKIAENVERLCGLAVPQYAAEIGLLESEQRRIKWRGRRDLRPALAGQKESVGLTKLKPLMTEKAFGLEEADSLPALKLDLGDGRTVLLRGKIDRVDVVPTEKGPIGIVFDYKSSKLMRLQLADAYHGLALQLLAYLLVLREHGKTRDGLSIIPGGACYMPLLAEFERVDDPAKADDSALRPFRPRGVVDFDALTRIEAQSSEGWSKSFQVFRNKTGGMGNVEKSDGVSAEQLPLILDHVRETLGALARRWLGGEISVEPVRLGKRLPCTYCKLRGLCRFEHVLSQTRQLNVMARTEVLQLIQKTGASGG